LDILVLTAKQAAVPINQTNRITPKTKETITMARQIRTFRDGETVKLSLHSIGSRDPWIVEAVILGREGTGAEERVHLTDAADPRNSVWDIYRHKGHWAWGTSGNRVTVFEENPKPRKPRTTRKPSTAPASTNNVSQITTAPKRRGRPRKTTVEA
jgi:hypothetical protein